MKGSHSTGRGAGRRSALIEARQLLAIWGALSDDDKTIDARIVSRRLGIAPEAAQRLVDLIISSRGNEDDFIPLYYPDENDGSRIALAPYGRGRGISLRLTQSEYSALVLALNTIGLASDSPLRSKLATSYGSPMPSASEIHHRITAVTQSADYNVLRACSKALVDRRPLRFHYRRTNDTEYHPRHALPLAMSLSNGSWLLKAFDYDRSANRTFRVDQMDSVTLGDEPVGKVGISSQDAMESNLGDAKRTVDITFKDPRFLDLFDWPGLEVMRDDRVTGEVEGILPYYEQSSDWLVRHIAACGGSVVTGDMALNNRIDEYIRTILGDTGGTTSP